MKKLLFIFFSFVLLIILAGCDGIFGGEDNDTIHSTYYEPVTGKFILYEALDKRYEYEDTYFEIDGTKGKFSLKYYENSKLKKEGPMQKIVTYKDRIGYWCNNLHFNIKIGNTAEHISAYTESFEPLNQFRIIEEYEGVSENKYYLSELPYVMGTYVRENKEYKKEAKNINKRDYLNSTIDEFTAAIDGKYALDEDHYFYFLSPKGWSTPDGLFLDSYFQYYSSELDKPIEGFVFGYTVDNRSVLKMKTLKVLTDWGKGSEGRITFGYSTFDAKDNMIDHDGTIDFSDGVLNSFTFEHLSRWWTDDEWDKFTKDKDYHMPDPILYDYIGGTYRKIID